MRKPVPVFKMKPCEHCKTNLLGGIERATGVCDECTKFLVARFETMGAMTKEQLNEMYGRFGTTAPEPKG